MRNLAIARIKASLKLALTMVHVCEHVTTHYYHIAAVREFCISESKAATLYPCSFLQASPAS